MVVMTSVIAAGLSVKVEAAKAFLMGGRCQNVTLTVSTGQSSQRAALIQEEANSLIFQGRSPENL